MSRPQVGVAVPEGPGGRLSAMTPAGGGGVLGWSKERGKEAREGPACCPHQAWSRRGLQRLVWASAETSEPRRPARETQAHRPPCSRPGHG